MHKIKITSYCITISLSSLAQLLNIEAPQEKVLALLVRSHGKITLALQRLVELPINEAGMTVRRISFIGLTGNEPEISAQFVVWLA